MGVTYLWCLWERININKEADTHTERERQTDRQTDRQTETRRSTCEASFGASNEQC